MGSAEGGFPYEPGPRGLGRLNKAEGSLAAVTFRNLGEFLARLEEAGDLARVTRPVSRDLEITEITQRALRTDGPALHFENVTGASMAVVTNLLGSSRRIAPPGPSVRASDLIETIVPLPD